MRIALILPSLFVSITLCSCEKDSKPVYDEYTGKKVLPFVKDRANTFGFANMISVDFVKDTIVLENNEYYQPLTDSIIDTVQYYKKYVEPVVHNFSMQVFKEMFPADYNSQPANDFNRVIQRNIVYDPEGAYGNMMLKIIHHSIYKTTNGDYIERKTLFYYNAARDEYYTDLN